MSTAPLTLTAAGPVPTSPTTLLANLIAAVAATNPDYTANLPGSLIEDISSTDVGALVAIDQMRVDAINNLTPFASNPYLLAQQGAMLGIPQGQAQNGNANVVFSGPVGYAIAAGFVVSDGTYQYSVQSPGGVITSTGQSNPLTVVATQSGSWNIPANSITTIVTSLPAGVTLTVTNPIAGTAGIAAQTVDEYRAQIMQAQIVTVQGVPTMLETLLKEVPGVNPRLVNILQQSNGWEVICGGGDSYAVAYAIYSGILDLTSIIGSQTSGRNVTVSLTVSPNTYSVVYVNPPQQVVTGNVVWNTDLSGFTNGAQVNALAEPALVNYINSIQVGQPINELEMTSVFQNAVASVLNPQYLSSLAFSIYINGVLTPPNAGTSIIPSDPESYFYASAGAIVVSQ